MRSRHFPIYSEPFLHVEFGGDARNAISRRNRDFFGIFCDSRSKTLSWCRVCAATNARLASETTSRPVGSRYETRVFSFVKMMPKEEHGGPLQNSNSICTGQKTMTSRLRMIYTALFNILMERSSISKKQHPSIKLQRR